MTTDDLMWIVMVISVVGTLLNARQNILCFPIWIATNLVWVAYCVNKGTYAMATLFSVYLVIAVYGWVCWKRMKT
jgi:nicotinamide riboside transporter PnuC